MIEYNKTRLKNLENTLHMLIIGVTSSFDNSRKRNCSNP